MNWADGIILCILGLSVLIGLMRGLVAELLSLVIWIAAFVVATLFGPTVAELLIHMIPVSVARLSVGYAICFVGVLLLGAILRFAARRLIWSTGLTGIDRVLGVVFGFVRGVLLVTLAVFLVGLTGMTRESWWQQSALLPQFQGTAAWLGQNIPASVTSHLHPEEVLDKLKSERILQRQPPAGPSSTGRSPGALNQPAPSGLLEKLQDLSGRLHGPMSAPRPPPPPAPARSVRAPAATGSISGPYRP